MPPDFPDVMVGASSPAQAVVGAYRARRLKIEHGQIDYVPGGPGRALVGHPGKVLRSFEIERMNRWDDDRDSAIMAWSVLDLAPLRAS